MTVRMKTGSRMSPRLSREEIEALCWRLTGWRGDPAHIDELLRAIDEYALSWGAMLPRTRYHEPLRPAKPLALVTRKATIKPKPVELKPEPKPPVVAEPKAPAKRELRCNHCGVFFRLDRMVQDRRRPDGVRTCCVKCGRAGTPANPDYDKQRVYSDATVPEKFQCMDCEGFFSRDLMRKDPHTRYGIRNRCLVCEQITVRKRKTRQAQQVI